FAIAHEDCLRMQIHGRANVRWHSVQYRTDRKFLRTVCFKHQVFFTVHDSFCIRQIQKLNTRVGHLGSNGFVTEIKAETISFRLADDPRKQHCGVRKIETYEFATVPKIQKHTGAGAALDIGAAGVDGKGWSAACNNARHRKPSRKQLLPQRLNGLESLLTC